MIPSNTKQESIGGEKGPSGTAAGTGLGQISTPTICLPKGGGAIRGIEEKFSVNPATGIGSLTVPIFTSPGRLELLSKVSLGYDFGSGNGPYLVLADNQATWLFLLLVKSRFPVRWINRFFWLAAASCVFGGRRVV
jgi:hypothetical protein